MRTCKVCKQEKDDWDFNPYIHKVTGKEYFKKICNTCRHAEEENQRLEREYGISRAQWKLILKSQNNKCKICGKVFTGRINVDHNHKTMVVRSLLCTNCNTGLGKFKDDPVLLQHATDYLKRKPNALKEIP